MNIYQMNNEDKIQFRRMIAKEQAIVVTNGVGFTRQEIIDFYFDKASMMEDIMVRYSITASDDFQVDPYLGTVEVGPVDAL